MFLVLCGWFLLAVLFSVFLVLLFVLFSRVMFSPRDVSTLLWRACRCWTVVLSVLFVWFFPGLRFFCVDRVRVRVFSALIVLF